MYRVKAQHGLVLFQTGIKEEKKLNESVICYVLCPLVHYNIAVGPVLFSRTLLYQTSALLKCVMKPIQYLIFVIAFI